jgi:DNA-binding transcriptional LysR family regulator
MVLAEPAIRHRAGRFPPQTRLKLPHLRLIAALDETGVVSAAAQALNMSQPAASRMIGEMEALLEAPLCERLARGVRLTPLGQSLARRARSVLQQLAEAEREFAELKAGRRGAVTFGAVSSPAFDLAAPALTTIRAIAPHLEIEIAIDSSIALARDLIAARHDFIIGRIPDDLDARLFETVSIGVERANLIVRRDHPLLKRPQPNVEALAAYPWVTQPRGTPLRRTIDNLFLSANLAPPERYINTTSLTLTMMLVARSDAVAAVSVEAARFGCEGMAPGALTRLPTPFPIVVQPYSLITMRNRLLSPAAQTVFEVIRAQAAQRSRAPDC